jgi:acyl CoA:acetate/3-ketoacid CoA transferase beta subunit
LLEGVWGALAAKRGAIVTVEKIVDDIRPWSSFVRIPGHRVLAVVETPMGAHPGGLYAGSLPVEGYGEDYDFWVDVRAATRRDDYDAWIKQWVLDVETQEQWIAQLGKEHVAALRAKADPNSWHHDEATYPPDLESPCNHWERAAVYGARHLARRCVDASYNGVLAGAGVANLSAWLGVRLANEQGSEVRLTAEIGLWGYDATPADPFVLNHRNFPTATMLGDASMVLGTLVGGPGTTVIGCLGGAQVDPFGNVNSTTLQPDGPFLVGSGGGNDVASTADENIVVATLTKPRTPEACAYITSPGRTVSAFVTDLGTFEKRDGDRFALVAVPAGEGSLNDRVEHARAACGFSFAVVDDVAVLPEVTMAEVEQLRRWDPRGWFLRAR